MSTFKTHFDRLIQDLNQRFLTAPVVEGTKWQSTNAPQSMVELFNQSFTLPLDGDDLDFYREVIKPNLPWADKHFEEERVSGEPINPGETWKIWPFARSAAAHLREGENIDQYDHSYAERYWPKQAGTTSDGRLGTPPGVSKTQGIRFAVGDLSDVVQILLGDPLTRQAYLPIFHPEDVGAALGSKRVPCTLGYHFIYRAGQLHVVYPMRSCDFIRHWRDDVYLTIRLQLWVLDQIKAADPVTWAKVHPGTFRMHMTSLHMFTSDRDNLRHSLRNRP